MNMLRQVLVNRSALEALFTLGVSLIFGLGIVFLNELSFKFQIMVIIALLGLLVIYFVPQKRSLLLFLWVIIQPLSIEKILYTGPGLWDELRGAEIILNAGDVILLMLSAVVLIDNLKSRQSLFIWDKKSSLFLSLLLWGLISYFIHLIFLRSSYVQDDLFGILHLARNLLFVVVIQSAIQTRANLIWVLVAVLISVALQSVIVSLSFYTHETYNFSRLLGQSVVAQTYSGTGESVTRAVGTLGIANQQAIYHAMFTFLLAGLFAVKSSAFRNLALVVALLSFIAVIFTFSRGAWLCVILASVLLVVLFFRRNEITSKSWMIGGFVLMAFVLALSTVIQPVVDRLTKGDDGATDSRIRMMQLAKDLWLAHPIIGVGPNAYVDAGLSLYPPGLKDNEWVASGDIPIVPPLGRIELARSVVSGMPDIVVPLEVHNKYMLLASELGSVGLIIWLLIFYEFYKDARTASTSNAPLLRYLGLAGFGMVLIIMVYMNLDLFSGDKTLQIILFPLLVISAAAKLSKKLGLNNALSRA